MDTLSVTSVLITLFPFAIKKKSSCDDMKEIFNDVLERNKASYVIT